MVRSSWLRRLGAGALAAGVGILAWNAAEQLGPPSMTASLTVAGAALVDPAAALEAVRQLAWEDPPAQPAAAEAAPSPQPAPAPVAASTAPEQAAASEPPPAASEQPEPQPTAQPQPRPENAGQIVTEHYEQGEGGLYIPCGAGTIKNCTSLSASQVADAASRGLPFSIEPGSSEPQVLIMHTHTTETYELEEKDWYDPNFTCRSTDLAVNMAAVGEEIAAQLNAAGIVTLHDTTLHDYPSYNGSYERSNETVRAYLEQYPSIKVVLDVHRDAIEPASGQRVSAVAEIDGQTAAQVMIICGADNGGNLPNFQQNLAFSAAWENAMESRYPGLTRPVLFDYRYYNQDLTTGSLLIEIGSHGNTLEQAKYSGRLVGQALAALFGGQ